MPRSGAKTRTNILNAAEALILNQGFSATSIDAITERAQVTKGTVFYHFDGKADLARALIARYAAKDRAHLEEGLERAERMSRDPLQQILIFVAHFEEMFSELETPYPGCLLASFASQANLFDEETLGFIENNFRFWRERLGAKLEAAAAAHPPKFEVDLPSLADGLTACFEGAFIMSRSLDEPQLVAQQLRHYRNYLELLFSG